MDFRFHNNSVIIDSDKKEIKLLSSTVDLDGLIIEMA